MEEGIAHIYLISSHLTTLKAKIEQNVPKKRKGPSNHDKAMSNFFHKILEAIVKHINFDIVKCIIVGSPGFTKDQFGNFLTDNITNNKHYEVLQKNLSKFIYVHCSNGYKQALSEILSKPQILNQIKNTKAADDVLVMEKFNEILSKDMERVIFGLKSVIIADEKNAIDYLIVSDDYIRKISPSIRKTVTHIIKHVKETGGEVYKMSSMHYTGEKINSFGGITAVLKYAIEELNEVEEDIVSTDNMVNNEHYNTGLEEEDKLAMLSLEEANLNENNVHEEVNELEQSNNEHKLGKIEKEEDEDDEEGGEDNYNDNLNYEFTKSKGKPSKLEKKERQQNRKIAARKKSSIDDD
jgi:protein pelota